MRWFMALAIVAATLGFIASPAQAGRSGGHHKSGSGDHRDHNTVSGRHDRIGSKGIHFYRGRHGHKWSRRYYWEKYHCHCYYSPEMGEWYYWCASDDCYYPTSNINTKPPVPEPEEDDEEEDDD